MKVNDSKCFFLIEIVRYKEGVFMSGIVVTSD